MPKNKRPVARKPQKSNAAPEDNGDALIAKLCDLAADLAADEAEHRPDGELNKIVKRCLHQRKDEILYEALLRASEENDDAFRLLKERVEEASEVLVTARPDGRNVEINAFAIPVFVRTIGGLQREACFQDQEAFEQLTASLQQADLESADAKVVLVSHAYHIDEIDAITYSHLQGMVRDAHTALTGKGLAPTPEIDRSISGWPASLFGAEDQTVELRFLLGFASKTTDDAFYRVPDDEAAADAYFAGRAERFERWAEQYAGLVKRCLVPADAEAEINFLYQDLFHGAKERGIAEYLLLQMMSELNAQLEESGNTPEGAQAIAGVVEALDGLALRVNLYAPGAAAPGNDTLLASCEKPCIQGRDPDDEFSDVYDALMTMGVAKMALAGEFSVEGAALDVRAYP